MAQAMPPSPVERALQNFDNARALMGEANQTSPSQTHLN